MITYLWENPTTIATPVVDTLGAKNVLRDACLGEYKWSVCACGRDSSQVSVSLRSRRLEVVGTRKNGRARGRHARGEGAPSRAPVLSFPHYFQAPATQAKCPLTEGRL